MKAFLSKWLLISAYIGLAVLALYVIFALVIVFGQAFSKDHSLDVERLKHVRKALLLC